MNPYPNPMPYHNIQSGERYWTLHTYHSEQITQLYKYTCGEAPLSHPAPVPTALCPGSAQHSGDILPQYSGSFQVYNYYIIHIKVCLPLQRCAPETGDQQTQTHASSGDVTTQAGVQEPPVSSSSGADAATAVHELNRDVDE